MNKLLYSIFAVLLSLVVSASAFAANYASRAEAQALAERAAKYFVEKGKDQAFSTFTAGAEGFKDRDLYVFVYDKDGVCVAHGVNAALVGKNLLAFKDVDGKELIKEIVSVASTGWVSFKWANPQTKAVEKKHAYVVHQGDYWFGVGAYEQQ